MDPDRSLKRAAEIIADADGLIIAAGAGMGVDSGLPDFRGSEGFWKAYPPYAKLGLDFPSLANPRWFDEDPALAWGFYGHRLNLYRETQPHAGFDILLRWLRSKEQGGFVFTSNVDGHFSRAGFDSEYIVEIHGAIERFQCTVRCGIGIFRASANRVPLNEPTLRAMEPFPRCPSCGGLARPNILMFGDWGWDSRRTDVQMFRLQDWLGGRSGDHIVIIECGAGRAVPTVRNFSERLVREWNARLIRINVGEPEVPVGQIGLAMGALEAIQRLDRLI